VGLVLAIVHIWMLASFYRSRTIPLGDDYLNTLLHNSTAAKKFDSSKCQC